ncbi:hypothetical protein MRB53_037047 [Persea americana]|nr:hypothetical protein MRB53_037047 [Persea americana]
MFWKSLDHQGISAKLADKRQFQTKTLQNEIQVKYEEQKRLRVTSHVPVPTYQAHYIFRDVDEFYQRVGTDKAGSPWNDKAARDSEDADNASDDAASAPTRKVNGAKTGLLRGLLDRGRNGKTPRLDVDGGAPSNESRASTPGTTADIPEDEEMPDTDTKPATWTKLRRPSEDDKESSLRVDQPYSRTTYNLYANLPIYCFFRLFSILYERLSNLKQAERDVHEAVRRAKAHKVAEQLRVLDKLPEQFFSDTSPTANYYDQIVGMFHDFLQGGSNGEMAQIEDVLRRFYLHSGWQLYSFDKMISALARFAVAILDSKDRDRTGDIMQLFIKDRRKDTTTHQEELAYRRQVEKYIKDPDVYRLTYVSLASNGPSRRADQS